MASSCRQLKAPVILNHANPFSVSIALAPSSRRERNPTDCAEIYILASVDTVVSSELLENK